MYQLEALSLAINCQLPCHTTQKMKHKTEVQQIELECAPAFRSHVQDMYRDILIMIFGHKTSHRYYVIEPLQETST